MLRLAIQLTWPWARTAIAKNWIAVEHPLTTNKFFELEVGRLSALNDILDINVDLTWRGTDHAGPNMSFTLLWFYFTVGVRDMRHWNYKTNQWYKYDSNQIYYEDLHDPH